MTKQNVFNFIDKEYSDWKPLKDDDLNIADMIEYDVIAEIMRYSFENNLELPGYDLKEVFAFIDRDIDAEDYDPDDVDFSLFDIYCDIALKMDQDEMAVPAEFSEVRFYFEKLFWPDWEQS